MQRNAGRSFPCAYHHPMFGLLGQDQTLMNHLICGTWFAACCKNVNW